MSTRSSLSPFLPSRNCPHQVLTTLSSQCPSTSVHLHFYFLSSNYIHPFPGNYSSVLCELSSSSVIPSVHFPYCHQKSNYVILLLFHSRWWLPIATRMQSKLIIEYTTLPCSCSDFLFRLICHNSLWPFPLTLFLQE